MAHNKLSLSRRRKGSTGGVKLFISGVKIDQCCVFVNRFKNDSSEISCFVYVSFFVESCFLIILYVCVLVLLCFSVQNGSSVFDASHYAFFGNHVVEEVELGGLEDEEDFPLAGIKKRYINKIEQNSSGFTLSSTKAKVIHLIFSKRLAIISRPLVIIDAALTVLSSAFLTDSLLLLVLVKLSSVQKNFRKHLCSFRKAFQKIGWKHLCSFRNAFQKLGWLLNLLMSLLLLVLVKLSSVEVGSSNPRWSIRAGLPALGRHGTSRVVRAGRPTRAGSSWVVLAGRPTRAGLPASASVVQPSSPGRVREPAVVYPSSTRVDMPLLDINKMEDSDFGWTGLDKEDDTHVTKEKSRYRYDGMLDTETMTNPTDKTVVHLLKHLKETKESCEGYISSHAIL
ncbi:hypothetical protein F2Q70_00026802 [Brassica cretica]|uniref:Uncharacterized protein n=1 Tax=Brassica cretica TaxID=69181 RepID=A0A8S9LB78_BRACR|nr:hypothetical protein F2Q70_00026802 [Brassica cretica]